MASRPRKHTPAAPSRSLWVELGLGQFDVQNAAAIFADLNIHHPDAPALASAFERRVRQWAAAARRAAHRARVQAAIDVKGKAAA